MDFSNVEVDELDDHKLHVEEHLRKLLSLDNENLKKSEYKNKIKKHITEHKKFIFKSETELVSQELNG